MFRTACILLPMFLLSHFPALAQDDSHLFLADDELNGGKTVRTGKYDGNSLWGYINGGADIYLEYGFKQAFVQEVRYNSILYKIEIYQMNDLESAYGIFSVSTFRCANVDSLLCRDYCETRYQVQFARADHYVSIINESGDKEGINYTRHLASQIGSKIEEGRYEFPALFQHELFQTTRKQGMKLIKGELGLQNGFAFWSGKFTFPGKCTIILLPMVVEEGEFNLAILEFPGYEERETFCKTNALDLSKGEEMVHRNSDTAEEYTFAFDTSRIIVLESFLPKEVTSRYIQAIEAFLSR